MICFCPCKCLFYSIASSVVQVIHTISLTDIQINQWTLTVEDHAQVIRYTIVLTDVQIIQWTLTVEDHDLGTNGGHGAGGVGVGGAPTDVAALVTHFRPADNKVTKQRERVLLMDPFGYQNPALPVLIPIGHEVPFKEPIDSVRGTT